jgi:Zn-dependent M28 family amino/carboxypeptidase
MTEITAHQLQAHVEKIAGKVGEHNVFHPEALHAVENYITDHWRQSGYEVDKQSYLTHGVECSNLEINCPGKKGGGEVILIGAHYDSVYGSPGANDNASGVAALLELARVFKEVKPPVNLRFVAFVNEEPPFFFWGNMGSMIYAKSAKRRGDRIRFMISLEMLGYYNDRRGTQSYPPLLKYFYPDTGNFIAFVSNLKSRSVMKDCVNTFAQVTDFPFQSLAAPAFVPGLALSDHLSFWRHGYKAFMITDTAFYRYPYYHTAEDTPDKLNYPVFAAMTNGLFLMLNNLQSDRDV